MLFIPTEIRPSPIHGSGVFLLSPVKKGDLVWRFDSRIDRIYSGVEVEPMEEPVKKFIETYGYWIKELDIWVMCGDNGKFVNHSDKNPTLVASGSGFGDDIAARDLLAGEELTSDYKTFCDFSREKGIL